jgi:hypothetical protein
MKILVDADTILEILINRAVFIDEVSHLSDLIGTKHAEIYMLDIGLEKIRQVIKKMTSAQSARRLTSWIRKMAIIVTTDSNLIQEARTSSLADFESAMELAWATKMGIGAILTHKKNDFCGASFPILGVSELRQRLDFEYLYDGLLYERDLPAVLVVKRSLLNNLDKNLQSLTFDKSTEIGQEIADESINTRKDALGITKLVSQIPKSSEFSRAALEHMKIAQHQFSLSASAMSMAKSIKLVKQVPFLSESLSDGIKIIQHQPSLEIIQRTFSLADSVMSMAESNRLLRQEPRFAGFSKDLPEHIKIIQHRPSLEASAMSMAESFKLATQLPRLSELVFPRCN